MGCSCDCCCCNRSEIDFIDTPVAELYGSNCFSDAVMREKLPPDICDEIAAIRNGEKELTLETAEVVAAALRDWAVEKGAAHYTHWFHPLTGLTAEKYESFITPAGSGEAIMELSGKALIKGESDAAGFPSGGPRDLFEARGYTVWDLTSPAFLKQGRTGTTLCIPTAFINYNGQALDEKVPLLKSCDALSKQAIRILRLLGNTDSKRVSVSIGAEQEYFLVDKKLYDRRPDLILTGRTVFGALSSKEQATQEHYYGAIKERVAGFMQEVNYELWKIGIPVRTQHNEAAPGQFEIVPVCDNASVALDANLVIMTTVTNIARRYGMEALLHEKPFAGVNGSGKHISWSLDTDDGINLFDPGDDSESNARFLLFTAAVIEAIDRYALLIRSSAAVSGNDHRLGSREAPPAIVSIFFGSFLTDIFDSIAKGKSGAYMKLGVTSLHNLPKGFSDRNRTSPFAFTGNKFEFRMTGSSQSIATPVTYLNAALTQVLCEFEDKLTALESRPGSEDSVAGINEVIQAIIKESYGKHHRVVFNGDGYAEKEDLPNVTNAVDALEALVSPESVTLFETHHILTREELESRYHIYLEKYSRQINIEASVSIDLARRCIFPAATEYAARLAGDSTVLLNAGANNKPQAEQAREITGLIANLYDAIILLETLLVVVQGIENVPAAARDYLEKVLPGMDLLRVNVDNLEKQVSREIWPLPGYEELLFNR